MFSKRDNHSTSGKDKKDQRIQVFARTRPLNASEIAHCSHGILDVCPERKEIKVKYGKTVNKAFAFDGVFGPETKQIHVYRSVVEPLIQEVLMGYNCTVFAYGQTSTGKTFTMEGERSDNECEWDKDPNAGIIPRSLHQLFEELNKEETVEFSVHVSFLELYNEELFDLLSPNEVQISKLRLFEDPSRKGSVVIQGLEEIKVNTKDEVYSILERGTTRRQTAATLLNASSSRSHTVFSVTVHIKENTIDGEELLKTGKLNLVDLAGSENISRSGAESSHKATREAGNINQSLLTLGRVITALVDKAPHIPYRESKLTRLLQDSLGGHTKTSIIATVSPALNKSEETLRTLDYAQRAKNITIQPEVNQKTTKRALIKEYTEEIERLRKDLVASRDKSGVFLHPENYLALQNNISLKEKQLEELNNKIGIMTSEIEKQSDQVTHLEQELTSTKSELCITTKKFDDKAAEFDKTVKKLSKTKAELKKIRKAYQDVILQCDLKQVVINVQSKTEEKLTKQANQLLEIADTTVNDVKALHNKIDRKRHIEDCNVSQSTEFQKTFQRKLISINDLFSQLAEEQTSNLNSVKDDIGIVLKMYSTYFSQFDYSLNDFESKIGEHVQSNTELFLTYFKKYTEFQEHNSQSVRDLKSCSNKFQGSVKTLKDQYQIMHESFKSSIFMLNQLINDIQTKTISKIKEIQTNFKSTSEAHRQQTLKLAQMFHDFYAFQKENIEKNDTKIFNLLSNSSTHNESIDKRLQSFETHIMEEFASIRGLVKAAQETVSNEINEATENQCITAKRMKIANDEFQREVESSNQANSTEEDHLRNAFHEFYNDEKHNEKHVKEKCESLVEEQQIIDKNIVNIFQTKENILKEQEQKIDDINESVGKEKQILLQNHNQYLDHIENFKTTVNEQFSEIKDFTTKHKEDILPHFNHHTDVLTTSTRCIGDTANLFKHEFNSCSTEMKNFVLQKDNPTGSTPEKKEYYYSREFAATSPLEKIMQQHRMHLAVNEGSTVKLSVDSSFDASVYDPDNENSLKESRENLISCSNYTSSDSDSLNSCTPHKSRIDFASDVKKYENQHSGVKPSRLPRRKSYKRKIRSQSTIQRKPLVPSNHNSK